MKRITTEQMIALLNIARMQSVCCDDQVGSVLYHPATNTLVFGYNHVVGKDGEACELPDGTTRPDVIHAEIHALHKARLTIHAASFEDCVLFVDRRPCAKCTPEVIAHKIPIVVYYRGRPDMEHLQEFEKAGILVGHGIRDSVILNERIQEL
ncbi:MAG: deaminase [Bacteroidaceae bacterium]